MKILILDEEQILYFNLPDTSEPYFVMNYESKDKTINEIVSLFSENNHWYIKSDYNVKAYSNDSNSEKIEISLYSVIKIHFEYIDKNIKLIAMPIYEDYLEYAVMNSNGFTIGCGDTNISVDMQGLLALNTKIEKNGENFYIKNLSENNFYINGVGKKESVIKFGDTIFIDGIKIIWFNHYFKMNTMDDRIKVNGIDRYDFEKQNVRNYLPTSESEHNLKLYNYDELFYHTPTIKDSIEKKTIRIEEPPVFNDTESIPLFLTMGSSMIIALSTIMSVIPNIHNVINGESDTNTWLNILLSIVMLIVCVLFPIIADRWQKKLAKNKEKKALNKYDKYLSEKMQEINEVILDQERILKAKHLDLNNVANQIINKGDLLWSREITEDDFMQVRLGIGDTKANLNIECTLEKYNLNSSELSDKVYEIANTEYKLKNVPITFNIAENVITPFSINVTDKDKYIKSILLQLMFYYSSQDLKLVIISNKKNRHNWDDIIYSNYCWSDDKKIRFFATNENEISQVSLFLEPIFQERLKNETNGQNDYNEENKYPYRRFSQYYLIVTDDYRLIKDNTFINKLLNNEKNYGISLAVFASNLKDLPSRLKNFIMIDEKDTGIFEKQNGKLIKTPFNCEKLNTTDIQKYTEILSNIPVSSKDAKEMLPSSVSFLEMYGAGKIEHLNILSRWNLNDPTRSLNAPLGLQSQSKLIGLDLHEKFHGPHGLIAGSTGSGKSEFIISYILSMAVNYHPYEVQFVLIDYKGGGLAGAFEKREKKIKIPHLVGTITNLDKGEMHRTLVAVKSELERRQVKFNEARDALNESTIDIYKYQRLFRENKVKDPISHLFIICDEFAELKAQQPDFMDELISTARIGRSLGVHLILATQKPSGVVNDQIWSNSRFKICLKVQSPEDSFEVLKKHDAAYIKETGRFYLQVGNDEMYSLGQSAWSGEKYSPTDHLIEKINDSIDFVGYDGTIIKSINDSEASASTEDFGDQLTNTVQYLYDLAVREKIDFNSLWLPNIPSEIYVMNILKKYEYKSIKYRNESIVGEYDMPTRQKQGLLTFDHTSTNTVIFGNPGSGKENMLTTIIYSLSLLHTVNEINFYIIDFGAETLNVFNTMPHVGEIITVSNKEKVTSLFEYLGREIKKRKELFSEYGGGFINYIKKSSKKVPNIVICLNGYENFCDNCPDEDYNLQQLIREGVKFGITFIVTANTTGSIRSSVLEFFKNKAILQIGDPFDYKFVLDAPNGMVPSEYFGRGIVRVDDEACEFQTAFVSKNDMINDVIKDASNKLSAYYKNKASGIKTMPKDIKFENMLKYVKYLNAIPVGYNLVNYDIEYYNFVKPNTNMIIGNSIVNDIEFMGAIIDLLDNLKGIKMNIFDFDSSVMATGNFKYYNSNYEGVFTEILSNKEALPTINVIIGIGSSKNNLNPKEYSLFSTIIANNNKLNNQYFIIFDNYDNIKNIVDEVWYENINKETGIWYGNGIERQNIFNISNIDKLELDSEYSDLIYVIDNNIAEEVRCVKEVSE